MKPQSIVPILPPNSTPAPEARPPAPDYQDYDTYDSDYSRPDYNDYNYNSGNEPSPPPSVNSNDYSNDYNYDYNSIDQGNLEKKVEAVCFSDRYSNGIHIQILEEFRCRLQNSSWK